MKKHGHLNRDIARILASMGHTDSLVIADCGLPIPPGVECVDLSLRLGQPGFIETLDSVLADFQCERAVFAIECRQHNPAVQDRAERMAKDGAALDFVSHEEFKQRCLAARAVIRTGECTPYANVILHSGVIF
ncbi:MULTISPECIES: D-ribose pyranase [Chromobacteriaceae]|uniref:D-ribose pyranase n=4 Tax=Chromobacteriaceae TaxID=1499392 RepID=A0ABV0HC12_9NEIS|nr:MULTISPECIES: D-ribose pyranase [Chromobacteriaceae]AVG17911.1 D-ribose pyranase [Chromobacterium vaccinii]ERE04593.1 ribose pyranase [Pseudogulbenkiania ferrooxidans EGD-HP2]MBX9299100.1 D-ribose pyranase [Chromobacterium vaccinii]MBX9347287.1 D-ribose pyranase [Chromobacterium vaccinii]MBX9358601.1 D-ribose pyranase [Chromobacterium vaccinii]